MSDRRRHLLPGAGLLILVWGGGGCSSGSTDPPGDVDITVEPGAFTPLPDGSTPVPFPLSEISAGYVGISGSYPYVLFYEDPLSCQQLMGDPDSEPLPASYTSILVLVGGWEEGDYPIIDLVHQTGPYSLESNAIAYLAERGEAGISQLEYASAGIFHVDQINQSTSTVKGTFDLSFPSGSVGGDFVIREYCDIY